MPLRPFPPPVPPPLFTTGEAVRLRPQEAVCAFLINGPRTGGSKSGRPL